MDDDDRAGHDASRGAGGAGPVSLDPAESLRIIGEQQARTRSATVPDGRLLFGVWGLAWLVGYLTLWFSSGGKMVVFPGSAAAEGPSSLAFLVFITAIALAVIFTIVHSVRRRTGTRGVSARAGALYGWSWMIGFAAMGLVVGGLARAGASDVVIALASNAFACVVVGLLYLGGGIAFRDTRLYVLGVWILLVASLATFAGIPLTYLIMATLGGGGFLLMGLVEHVLLVRRRRGGAMARAGGR